MKLLDLVGSRVWIRCDQFRKISGVVKSVPKQVHHDDLQSSIAASLFKVVLPSGRTLSLLGDQICSFEPHPAKQSILRSATVALAPHPGD